jgi:hypothetical protein
MLLKALNNFLFILKAETVFSNGLLMIPTHEFSGAVQNPETQNPDRPKSQHPKSRNSKS